MNANVILFLGKPHADRWKIAWALVDRAGQRAHKVARAVHGPALPWTPEGLHRAAVALESGDRAYGIARPWPHLAGRIRTIVKDWQEANRSNGPIQE